MKPTKEIIDIATQLHKLGVKKEPELGVWFVYADEAHPRLWAGMMDGVKEAFSLTVIPPLEWCLEWLAKNVPYPAIYADVPVVWYRCTWLAQYRNKQGLIDVFSTESCSTPHLAVLKAMLAVKTAK